MIIEFISSAYTFYMSLASILLLYESRRAAYWTGGRNIHCFFDIPPNDSGERCVGIQRKKNLSHIFWFSCCRTKTPTQNREKMVFSSSVEFTQIFHLNIYTWEEYHETMEKAKSNKKNHKKKNCISKLIDLWFRWARYKDCKRNVDVDCSMKTILAIEICVWLVGGYLNITWFIVSHYPCEIDCASNTYLLFLLLNCFYILNVIEL